MVWGNGDDDGCAVGNSFPPLPLTPLYHYSVPGDDWRLVIQTGSSWSLPSSGEKS